MSKRVWVVEMFTDFGHGEDWQPVVGIGLDREQARGVMRQWKTRCRDDRFRVKQYTQLAKTRKHNKESR
jgi:hypothetical protein